MKQAFIFVVGAAAGSAVTWYVVKEKYRRLAEEEIEQIAEHYKNKEDKKEEEKEDLKVVEHYLETDELDGVKKEYTKRVKELGYDTEDVTESDEDLYTVQVENGPDVVEPFVISPDDLGDMPGYDVKQGWTYYADFILTDENDEVVTDAESIIGDALSHFGEYADDAVYVRNDNLMCDYEILKIEKTYDEIFN